MTTTINRYRGDTKPIVITCQSGGSPMNLTGCSGFRMTADPLESPSDSANNIFSLDGTILSALFRRPIPRREGACKHRRQGSVDLRARHQQVTYNPAAISLAVTL